MCEQLGEYRMINELVKNVIKTKEQLEMDAKARIFAEQRYIECSIDNERLAKELKKALKEIEDLRDENTKLRSAMSNAKSTTSTGNT